MASVESCLANNESVVCGLSTEFGADGDIAGPGVFYAFAISSLLTMIVSFWILSIEGHGWWSKSESRDERKKEARKRNMLDAISVGLSDSQIITTLALILPTLTTMKCNITAYHYSLLCKLVLISSAAHLGAMTSLHRYFSSPLLGTLRVVMILVIYGMAWYLITQRTMSHIFPAYIPTSVVEANQTGLILPAVCFSGHPGVANISDYSNFTASPFWSSAAPNLTTTVDSPFPFLDNTTTNSNITAAINSTVFEVYSNFDSDDNLDDKRDLVALFFVFLAFLLSCGVSSVQACMHGCVKSNRFFHLGTLLLRACCFVVSLGVALYGIIYFRNLQNWMLGSGLFGDDDGETNMKSYGQFMPVILLFIPVITFCESVAAYTTSDQNGNKGRSNHGDEYHELPKRGGRFN